MIIMNMQNKLYARKFSSPPKNLFVTPQKKSNSQPREEQRASCPPQPTPIHKLSITSMVWNISMGQLGYLSVCTPSQLLHDDCCIYMCRSFKLAQVEVTM